MKILYFGTVCDIEEYNKILSACKVKSTVATVVFETALLDGFKKNGVDIEIHSFPMIPTFPKSKMLKFGKTTESLKMGYTCRWLNTVNVPILKQISRSRDARKIIKRWLKANAKDGIVMTYSIPPFLVKDVIKYSKKYSAKKVAIVPDLPRDMYINEKASILTKLKQRYLKNSLKFQGEYDAYIYLTDAMHNEIAPNKPYIVMEGIADNTEDAEMALGKSGVKAIMYAGMLHKKYGIMNLLEAFNEIHDEKYELWLFGEGTAVEEIKKCAEKNSQIKYFGVVSRERVLEYEKKATFLINPRDPNEEFTKYSFPSKTIEYMLSGTPLITTKLGGIPKEYFEYVIGVDDNSVDALKKAILYAFSLSDEECKNIASSAKKFIKEEKNSKKQTARIVEFLKEV